MTKSVIVIPSIYAFQSHTGNTDWSVKWIFHGVASIISYVKSKGLQLNLVDMRRCNDWVDYLKKIDGCDMIFFTVATPDFHFFMNDVMRITKAKCPNAKIIVGGIHPTMKPEDFRDDERVDYIVKGEGEIATEKILKNEITEREFWAEHPDVNDIPPIDRALWESEYPIGIDFSGQERFYTMFTSRACVYNCSFCQPFARTMFGKGERRREVAKVIEEMKQLKAQQMNSFMIHDDGFVQNKKWIDEFVETYKQNFEPMPFIIQIRANHLCDEDLIGKLKSIGLEWVIVGFESGSDNVLKILRKGTTREMNLQAARTARKLGVKVFANIMYGIPGETKDDVLQTVSMLKEIKPDLYSPATYSPYAGSDLYEYCKKNDLIITEYADRTFGTPKLKGIDYEFLNSAAAQIPIRRN